MPRETVGVYFKPGDAKYPQHPLCAPMTLVVEYKLFSIYQQLPTMYEFLVRSLNFGGRRGSAPRDLPDSEPGHHRPESPKNQSWASYSKRIIQLQLQLFITFLKCNGVKVQLLEILMELSYFTSKTRKVIHGF